MKFRLYIAIIMFVLCHLQSTAEDADMLRLDHEISRREIYQKQKQDRMDSLSQMTMVMESQEKSLDL